MSECDAGNGYDGQLGARISSIFVILVGSSLGKSLRLLLLSSMTDSKQGHGFPYFRVDMQQSACPSGHFSLPNTSDLVSNSNYHHTSSTY